MVTFCFIWKSAKHNQPIHFSKSSKRISKSNLFDWKDPTKFFVCDRGEIVRDIQRSTPQKTSVECTVLSKTVPIYRAIIDKKPNWKKLKFNKILKKNSLRLFDAKTKGTECRLGNSIVLQQDYLKMKITAPEWRYMIVETKNSFSSTLVFSLSPLRNSVNFLLAIRRLHENWRKIDCWYRAHSWRLVQFYPGNDNCNILSTKPSTIGK